MKVSKKVTYKIGERSSLTTSSRSPDDVSNFAMGRLVPSSNALLNALHRNIEQNGFMVYKIFYPQHMIQAGSESNYPAGTL